MSSQSSPRKLIQRLMTISVTSLSLHSLNARKSLREGQSVANGDIGLSTLKAIAPSTHKSSGATGIHIVSISYLNKLLMTSHFHRRSPLSLGPKVKMKMIKSWSQNLTRVPQRKTWVLLISSLAQSSVNDRHYYSPVSVTYKGSCYSEVGKSANHLHRDIRTSNSLFTASHLLCYKFLIKHSFSYHFITI